MFGLPASGVASIIPEEYGDSLGMWTGMMWSICSVFALTGPPIAGEVAKRGGINAIGYWCGCNLLVAVTLISSSMIVKYKQDGKKPPKSISRRWV